MGDDWTMDQFKKDIAGALRDTIHAHGPITEQHIGSATKRIAAGIRNSLKRERDVIAASEPKRGLTRETPAETGASPQIR